MKRRMDYWRWVYRSAGGWRGMFYCLDCLYGPRAWKRMWRDWQRGRQIKRMVHSMTPIQRAELQAELTDLTSEKPRQSEDCRGQSAFQVDKLDPCSKCQQ